MNRKLTHKYFNGYSLSLLLHALLLLLGALYVIKPQLQVTWHQFAWESPEPGFYSDSPAARGLPQESSASASAANEAGIPGPSATSAETAEHAASQRIVELPLETPQASNTSSNKLSGVNRQLGSSALRELGSKALGGNMGFSSSLEPGSGDAYVIEQLKPQIVPSQDGEVLLEFRLSPQGRVVMNSVKVLSFSSAAYVEAVRKVMPEWRFGFRKAYAPQKVYRLRCKFVTNE